MNAAQNAIDYLMNGTEPNTSAVEERTARRDASQLVCVLPDWTGHGGVVQFWLNPDGTYGSMDSRIDDKEIRRGMMLLSAQ